MKRNTNLLLFIGCTATLGLFISGKKPKDYSKALPGVVKVSETLYYDRTEITNLGWLEYLHWQVTHYGKDSPEYAAVLPDTNVWGVRMQPYITHYLRHTAFRSYPVVGVSWAQANDYCKWRTERVKEVAIAQKKAHKLPAQFNYRLPTKAEFLLVYGDVANLPQQIGEEGPKGKRGMHRFNLKGWPENMIASKHGETDVCAPANSYCPTPLGIYNIKGNVAEWLQEPNTYIGGGWDTHMDADVSVPLTLDSASAQVGFRCVCEVGL